MKFKYLLALLLLATSMSAQNLPFKPEPTTKVKLTCGDDLACKQKWYTYPDTQKDFYEELPVSHRTADKAFFLWEAVSQIVTVADAENSIYALQHTPSAIEANPIFGKNPSRLRYYALMEGLYLAEIPFTWHYKRQDDAIKAAGFQGHKYAKWWILPAINTTAHGIGIGVTLSSTGR